MKTYTIQELRNAPIQIKVYSEEQAIQLAYAVGYDTEWKPYQARYPIYCYLKEFNYPLWNNSEKERKDKPTIIEFNQIENFMKNKKIIGYKLIKPEYGAAACRIAGIFSTIKSEGNCDITIDSMCVTELKKAGVLDLWFEPVYQEEYKAGDFVITENYSEKYDGIALEIIEIKKGEYCYFKTDDKNTPNFHITCIKRRATEEEIKKVQTTIITMYSSNKGNFEIEIQDGKAYYRPENKKLPKEWIKDIINTFDKQDKISYPYKIEIKSVNVGCMEGTKKSDWEKVYKLLK